MFRLLMLCLNSQVPLNIDFKHALVGIDFKHALVGNRGDRWIHLLQRLTNIHLPI
jgi:hypothetical protein